ncbi:MAG TPA: CaiB/BaiF CoA-transferase family protein [Acidimicrobiales bacterium]|nr:CaiB/BaiF CoA-transferase family protein [Acidimicrobiales bacterium]
MGPLHGVRVVEVASIGPGPFTAMLLADMGAEVVRVDRVPAPGSPADASPTAPDPAVDVLNRGRRSVAVDLKHPDGAATLLRLAEQADVLLEGFRPGVMERLGLGPELCLARNPRLVYGRMTGWGQDGPLAAAPGHDINFIAVAGALRAIARPGERPVPPLNLVGDFGGGGLLQAFGVVCALLEARASGQGQVVDTAMADGAALLMAMVCSLRAAGKWSGEPGANLLDGGAPFYDTYETADGEYVAVGAIEPRFYDALLAGLGLDRDELPDRLDRSGWTDAEQRVAAAVRTRTRAEWCEHLEGTDACLSPVLGVDEAAGHPQLRARRTYVELNGVVQPAPAPRLSRTPAAVAGPPPHPGQHTDEVLAAWRHTAEEIAHLRQVGAVA